MAEAIKHIPGFGRVGIQLTGLDKLNAALNRLAYANKDVGSILRLIGERMRRFCVDNIKIRKTQSDGTPWPPMSEATKAMRRTGGGTSAPRLLEDTGRLRTSIAYKVEGNTVYTGTNVDYARDLQFGDESKNLPAREFIWINDKTVEDLVKMLTNETIVSAIRGA